MPEAGRLPVSRFRVRLVGYRAQCLDFGVQTPHLRSLCHPVIGAGKTNPRLSGHQHLLANPTASANTTSTNAPCK